MEKDEKAERGWDDETSELFDNLIEYDLKRKLKDNMERERERIYESNKMLNPIHNIPFSLGAFSRFYPMYILSLLTVYFINLKKVREI